MKDFPEQKNQLVEFPPAPTWGFGGTIHACAKRGRWSEALRLLEPRSDSEHGQLSKGTTRNSDMILRIISCMIYTYNS